jgi:hypothetical protein
MKQLQRILLLAVAITFLALPLCASAGNLWGTGSPDWGSGTSGPSPVIFLFNTDTGKIKKTISFEQYNWMWISGLADSGKFLYASHNAYDESGSLESSHNFKIAKIDEKTGEVLSDTSIAEPLGQTYSQVNALDFLNGKLYAVENATSGSTLRGYAIEITLDENGNVNGANQGAYVGPYPDCGLDYRDGLWYATSWGYTQDGKQGSIVYTSPDIMNTEFTEQNEGYAVDGITMIDGLAFDNDGNLFAVCWYANDDISPTAVYSINTSDWTATFLYDLASQLHANIISLDGLSNVGNGQKLGQTKDGSP